MMEDLTERAYIDRLEEGLSKRKVESVVRHLAAFHKFILCAEDREKLLEPFQEIAFATPIMVELFGKTLERGIEAEPAMGRLLRRMRRAVIDEGFVRLAYRDLAKRAGLPEVLVHSDFKTNNLLWRRSEDGRETDELAAVIDWQMVFVGNPMADIARVITCCETEVRRDLETYIFQLYHDELSKLMGRKLSFTVDDLRPAYDIMIVNQAVMHTAGRLSPVCLTQAST